MGLFMSRFRSHAARGTGWGCVLLFAFAACDPDDADTSRAGAGRGGASNAASGGQGAQGGSAAGTPSVGGNGAGTAGTSGSSGEGAGCDTPGLTWKTARKTWYTSYPDPNSEECIEFNGCTWAGLFAACDGKKSEEWVSKHDIVAAFPGFDELELHDLCIKSGDKTLVVTVYDTCADSDCSGCCTQNQADNDALIDLESYTNERWGVEDGVIQWADLGPTQGDGCN
jgi:hypothetical protein